MAITTSCKVTYSLKTETVERVQELATQWGVPKSEVIRRVIDEVKNEDFPAANLTPLQALKELQTKVGITKAQAKKFKDEVRLSRHASGRKRG